MATTNKVRLYFQENSWKKEKLNNIVLELKSGLSRMLSDNDIGIPVIRSINISDHTLNVTNLKYWYLNDPQGANTENYHLVEDDILINFINSMAQIGKVALYKDLLGRPCIYTTNILVLKLKAGYSNKFIYYFFQTKKYKNFIQSITKPAVNQASFTTKDFRRMDIYFPSLKEQNKIANFLSSVDKKITLQSRKIELLQQYKKGLIENIFSQKIRFENNNCANFSEWNECELSSVALKVNIKNKDESISNVLTNSATQGIVSQADYFDREIVTSSNLGGYYVVNIGDFVYNPRISSSAPVGPIKMNKHSLGVMSPLYTVFRFTKGNNQFYQYFFESTQWYDYMKSVANSGARHDRMNITTSHFLGLPIPQPLEEEQQKIADFLSSIDDKITIENNKLDKLKQWKQGLLQQMFV